MIPYAAAIGATEIPWALGQTLLFSCISYFMIHFDFTAGELIRLKTPHSQCEPFWAATNMGLSCHRVLV